MYTHQKNIIKAGVEPKDAKGAIIMLHGRGSTADNIIGLNSVLNINDLAIYAPQASNHSWYPYSFMAPVKDNEPALSSALELIKETVQQAVTDGIPEDRIYFAGFSQGACLTLEYVARNAKKYAGVVAFTGGLIGEQLPLDNYQGDFNNTPIFIATGDPDAHVPVTRVLESVEVLNGLNADIRLEIYKGRQHTISMPEIKLANELIFDQTN